MYILSKLYSDTFGQTLYEEDMRTLCYFYRRLCLLMGLSLGQSYTYASSHSNNNRLIISERWGYSLKNLDCIVSILYFHNILIQSSVLIVFLIHWDLLDKLKPRFQRAQQIMVLTYIIESERNWATLKLYNKNHFINIRFMVLLPDYYNGIKVLLLILCM